MNLDQLTNLLVAVTLIQMMATIGLGVTLGELGEVARNGWTSAKALFANYVCVPAAALGLLLLFGVRPMTAAGFLILAVCPGAPFGPPFTSIAKGNTPLAVGLMVLLAGSSAVLAPLLLALLLPWVAGDEKVHVDAFKLAATLLFTQLLPLGAGLATRRWRPVFAAWIVGPANQIGKVLNLATCGLILATQYPLLLQISPSAWFGMALLLLASMGAGWICGGPAAADRRALTLTTSLRNVGVGLVIASGSFAGTTAVTAVSAYGIFEVFASFLLARWWGRRPFGEPGPVSA